jgi:hypothetical protein
VNTQNVEVRKKKLKIFVFVDRFSTNSDCFPSCKRNVAQRNNTEFCCLMIQKQTNKQEKKKERKRKKGKE